MPISVKRGSYDPGSVYNHLAVGETSTVLIDYTVQDSDGANDTGRQTITSSNDGPTVATPIADQDATEDTAFSYQVPAGASDDLDAGETATYTLTNGANGMFANCSFSAGRFQLEFWVQKKGETCPVLWSLWRSLVTRSSTSLF